MNDLISVILPVYNVEKYLSEALDSVINQTYKNLEIILVDDGSPDNSGKICDEYAEKDARIKVIHKENGGVSSARNAGIDASTGDWLYFMDPDDWIELNTFELVLAKANETSAEMVFFDYYKVFSNKKTYFNSLKISKDNTKYFFDNLDDYETFVLYYGGSMCTSIIKKKCIESKVRFDESVKMGEDYIFRKECYSYISSFAYIPKALYNYRDNELSAMHSFKEDFKKQADIMHEKMYELKPRHKYPDYIEIDANSRYIHHFDIVLSGVLSSNSLSWQKKKEIIFEYINSDNFQNALKNYEKRLVSGMVKIIVSFKKPTMFKIYCVYIIRNIKKYIDKFVKVKHKLM